MQLTADWTDAEGGGRRRRRRALRLERGQVGDRAVTLVVSGGDLGAAVAVAPGHAVVGTAAGSGLDPLLGRIRRIQLDNLQLHNCHCTVSCLAIFAR